MKANRGANVMTAVKMICETCGGELNLSTDKLSAKCPYCRNTYYFKEEKSEALILALNRAAGHRLACDFHEAIKEYKLVLDKAPNDAEAHFGMLLATYGIEYVKDPRTEQMIPTVHRYVERNILDDPSYLAAISNAAEEQKSKYEEDARVISKLQKRIKMQLEDEDEYEVFISLKSTDENGNPTKDRKIARKIYDELNSRGIKAFFSEVTLKSRLGDEYEPIIFKALMSAKVFLLVATNEEHISAVWVKNEWARFEDRIENEHLTGTWFAVFEPSCQHALPPFLRTQQGVDLSKYPADGYETQIADNLALKLGKADPDKSEADELRRELEEQRKRNREFEEEMRAWMENMKKEAGGKSETPTAEQPKAPIAEKPKAPIIDNPSDLEEFEKICEVKDSVLVRLKDKTVRDLVIPSGITEIRSCAFSHCIALTSITIPSSVKAIGFSAFSGCKGLTSITIPNSVTAIEERVFADCTNLTSITIPSSVIAIGDSAFSGCIGLTRIDVVSGNMKYKSIDGNLYTNDEKTIIQYAIGKNATSFSIPSSVTAIENNAFSHCTALTSVTIPSSVKKIGKRAFWNFIGLTGITIPNGVTAIEDSAFWGCTGLKSITIPSSVRIIGNSAFSGCKCLTSVTIPNGIKKISENVFRDCISLTSITIPSSVIAIGNTAFWGCKALTSINFEGTAEQWKTIKKITGWDAFTGSYTVSYLDEENSTDLEEFEKICRVENGVLIKCRNKSIESIEIPEGITKIGDEAFENCSKLKNVQLPKSLTVIGDFAFTGCDALVNISLPDGLKKMGVGVFDRCKSLTSIHIPKNAILHGSICKKCNSLESITVDESNPYLIVEGNCLMTKDNVLLMGCKNSIIPKSTVIIGSYAFAACSNLKSAILPEKLREIRTSAFEECDSLTEIFIPDGVKSISDYAFSNCANIKYVRLPSDLKTIASQAFFGCDSLKEIIIPETTVTIAAEAFDYCPSLRSITIPKKFKDEMEEIFGTTLSHSPTIIYT